MKIILAALAVATLASPLSATTNLAGESVEIQAAHRLFWCTAVNSKVARDKTTLVEYSSPMSRFNLAVIRSEPFASMVSMRAEVVRDVEVGYELGNIVVTQPTIIECFKDSKQIAKDLYVPNFNYIVEEK